jgi:hypothetical protein
MVTEWVDIPHTLISVLIVPVSGSVNYSLSYVSCRHFHEKKILIYKTFLKPVFCISFSDGCYDYISSPHSRHITKCQQSVSQLISRVSDRRSPFLDRFIQTRYFWHLFFRTTEYIFKYIRIHGVNDARQIENNIAERLIRINSNLYNSFVLQARCSWHLWPPHY